MPKASVGEQAVAEYEACAQLFSEAGTVWSWLAPTKPRFYSLLPTPSNCWSASGSSPFTVPGHITSCQPRAVLPSQTDWSIVREFYCSGRDLSTLEWNGMNCIYIYIYEYFSLAFQGAWSEMKWVARNHKENLWEPSRKSLFRSVSCCRCCPFRAFKFSGAKLTLPGARSMLPCLAAVPWEQRCAIFLPHLHPFFILFGLFQRT